MHERNLEALIRYYTHLANFGYMSQSNINALLIYSFLIEFIDKYQAFMTKDTLTLIQSKLNCLTKKSCLLPVSNVNISDLISSEFGTDVRVSENYIPRVDFSNCNRGALV